MAFNFPSSPNLNDVFTAGDASYVWNGYAWSAKTGSGSSEFVERDGDTMTGPLVLPADPVSALQAAPKQYVDAVRTYAAPLDAMAYSGMQVNGSMEVSQEFGTTYVTGAANICDSWTLLKVGSMNSTSGRLLDGTFPGFSSYIFITTTVAQPSLAAGDIQWVYSKIEGYRVSRLAWGKPSARPITIGFWTAHVRTGTYSVSITGGTANRCYVTTYTQNVSGVPEYKTVTIPGDTAGTWATDNTIGMQINFPQAVGASYTTASPNVWQSGSFYAATGQVNAVAATSDSFRITGVVVLPGTQAPTAAQSPLIMRPYDQELLLCQRYYEKKQGILVRAQAVTAVYSWLPFLTKRVVPTSALANTSYSSGSAGIVGQTRLDGAELGFMASAAGAGGYMSTDVILDARL